jgi:hypothetical protein
MDKRKSDFWGTLIVVQVLCLFFFDFDIYYQVAMLLFNYQFLSFFFNIGQGLNIRYLIGTVYTLNYLLGPVLMYTWLNDYVEIQYTLKGKHEDYFEYVIPAIGAMLIGLNMFKQKTDNALNIGRLKAIIENRPRLPMQMIIVGTAVKFVENAIPDEIDLLTSALSNLRYVGFFLHLLFAKRINYIYFAVTYGFLIFESIVSSLFNDLLNLLFFLASIIAIRYKPSNVAKIGGIVAGMAVITFIQVIKMPLRNLAAEGSIEIENIESVIEGGVEDNKGKTFDKKVADVVFRMSQGWVASNVITYYYDNHGFELQGGSHIWIMIKSSVLPRILAPDKYKVGDRELFNTYTGHIVSEGTSIALGIVSDAFIDLGQFGFIICFFWGLAFSLSVRFYSKWDIKFPLFKLTSILCYFYAMRADTDTHSSLGALIKVTFVLWLVSYWFDKYFFKFFKSKKIVLRRQAVKL